MTFLWPEFLWLLLLVPVLVAVYVLTLRKKRKIALRYASLSMVKDAMGTGARATRLAFFQAGPINLAPRTRLTATMK